MTDLTTRARELCEGGVNPELVRTVYELCEALEKAESRIERLKTKVRQIVTGNAVTALHYHKQIERDILYGDGTQPKGLSAAIQESENNND